MFCKYCGNEMPEQANFCSKCGKMQANEEPAVYQEYEPVAKETYVYETQEDPFKEEKAKQSKSILILSIVGLALSVSGTFSLVGLIISCIARSKIGSYLMAYDEPDSRVRVAKGLSTGGLIAGIVCTILFAVYFILYFAIIMAEIGYYW